MLTHMPSHWKLKTLGEVTDKIDYGHTASAVEAPIGPKFLRITDIYHGRISWDDVPHCDAHNGDIAKYRLETGDIVIARTGSAGNSQLISECPTNAIFASYLIRVRPSSSLDSGFLSYFFKTPYYWNQLRQRAAGAIQLGINATKLKSLEIPLPPLSEQKRIANILESADAIRRKRREAIRVDALIKGIFFDMFGEPLTAPAGPDTVPFDHLTNRITYGFTCPMDHVEKGIPIVTGKNIRDGYIEFGNVHYARQDQFDSLTDKSKPVRGDILIIKDGAIRGRCAILDTNRQICINQSVALVQPNRERVTPEFLYGYLSSTLVRRKIDSMDKGVAMPHLQITELAKFPVRLPPLKKQEQFSRMYRQALRVADRISQSMSGLDDLFNSLVQRAFKGEL